MSAADEALVERRLASAALPVREVQFIADLPQKHRRSNEGKVAAASHGLRELIASAQSEVLLQTPYLVLSPEAQDLFRELHARDPRPRVLVSTNSLAATDAFIAYALSYKYKRRYLRDFGFEIHEFKPFPEDAPIDLDATGAFHVEWREDGTPVFTRAAPQPGGARPLGREYSALRWSGFSANEPVPLERSGVRFGLHAKSLVVDERIGVVGIHVLDRALLRLEQRLGAREIEQDAGERDERIWGVGAWRESPHFSAAERAALALGECLTRMADRSDAVPDDVWADAAEHYDEQELA